VLLIKSLNIFASGWQQSIITSYNHPPDGPNWTRVWLLPLETGHDQANDLLTAELRRQLSGIGVQAELAPANYQMAVGEAQPVVLEYAAGDWSNRWALWGRTAVTRVIFRTSLYGDLSDANTLRMQGSVSGVGRYRGLVQSSRVGQDMANRVVSAFVKQLADNLGLGLLYANQSTEQNGFHWAFSLRLPTWNQRPEQHAVSHALVLQNVDYTWQFLRDGQPQQVYLYRTTKRGDELERELLERLPADYVEQREFINLDYNGWHRRSLSDGLVSHWNAASEALFDTSDPLQGPGLTTEAAPYANLQDQQLERYVLVVDPPLAASAGLPCPLVQY
jgi:hypothetical protein